MRFVRIVLALLIAGLLCLAANGIISAAELPRAAQAIDSVVGDPGQWMDISTNATDPVSVEIRKSHGRGDQYCRDTESEQRAVALAAGLQRILFAFARQQEPGIALYEWHVCFVIDGTAYRAWHGFDPGPGATLHANCFIDAAQIAAKDLTRNICPTADVTANPANYAEYSARAPTVFTPEPCLDVSTYNGAGPRAEECSRRHGAFDNEPVPPGANPRQRDPRAPHFNVTTNSPAALEVEYRLSRTPNDYDCKLAQGTHWTISNRFMVGADAPRRINIGSFGFLRQFLPAVAAYEWHICFVIDNTLYRAWRGYDPGPSGALSVDCFIDAAVLRAGDTTHYLCSKAEAALNPANYNEFGIYCEPGNARACRRFGTKEDYDNWLGLQNPLSTEEQDKIAEAVLIYAYTHDTYLSANRNFGLYLRVRGKDPSPEFLARVSAATGVDLKPGSALPAERAQPGVVVLTGRNMQVGIGEFTITQPNVARGGAGGYCGALCAGGSDVTVEKRNGAWEVTNFKLTSVQ